MARSAGGPAYGYYAPIVLPDAATARALRRQSDVARAFDQVPRITKAVVGLGLCAPGQSTLYDALGQQDHAELRELGICAEVSGVFLSSAIAYGTAKVPAARAALRSGLMNGFVTHASFARALLDGS